MASASGALLPDSDYFVDNTTNSSKEFRCCFTINKELFMQIVFGVGEYDDYFMCKKDCTRLWGSHRFRNALFPYGAASRQSS
jgi:hypothetical protein